MSTATSHRETPSKDSDNDHEKQQRASSGRTVAAVSHRRQSFSSDVELESELNNYRAHIADLATRIEKQGRSAVRAQTWSSNS